MVPEGERNALFWQPDRGRLWPKIAIGITGAMVVVGIVVFVVLRDDTTPKPDRNASTTLGEPTRPGPSDPTAVPDPVKPSPVQPSPAKPTQPSPSEPSPVKPSQPEPSQPEPSSAKPSSAKPSSAKPSPAAPGPSASGLAACVAKHYAPDAFGAELPKFDFVCTRKDPRKGAIELGARLVYAQKKKGGPVTDAMKEWSILNWYELAFFAIVQRACCEAPPALDTVVGKTCDFDAKLTQLGEAGHTGKNFDEAITAFDKSVQCLINFGLSPHYKQRLPTYGPERDAFRRISDRSRSAGP